jgi:hypothetical protein
MIHLLAPLGVVILLAVLLLTDAGEIRRRLREAGHLIAGRIVAFADLCGLTTFEAAQSRMQAPSGAHPAAKAAQRCSCDACTADLSPVDFAEWERDVRSGRPS